MSEQNAIKIVVDTSVWISFLIGKRLLSLKNALAKSKIEIYFSQELYSEIIKVLNYPRLSKIIPENKFSEIMATLGEKIRYIKPDCIINDCRDPKDNFILELAVSAKADYLISSDADLLVLNPYRNIKILKPSDFESILAQLELL